MPSIEKKLKNIKNQIQNPDPEVRYEALSLLEQLKVDNEEDVNVDIIVELVETAAQEFPRSVGEWDDPSYFLIDFICDYRNEEIIDCLKENFNGFSWSAKARALSYLIELEHDKSLSTFMDILEQTMENGDSPLLVETLKEHPGWAVKVVEKFYRFIKHDFYKQELYELLSHLHREDVFYQFKKEEIYPQLIQDYKKEIDNYQKYDDSYSIQHVYNSWKAGYLQCRDKMDTYLSLFVYYYSEEVKNLIAEALSFKDPILKTRAAITALQKDIEVDSTTLLECASNLESADIFHWELMRIRKEHLNPLEKRQPAVARTHLFFHSLDALDDPNVPMEVNIVDYIDTQNHYGQPVRYHLAKLKIDGREDLPGWIGAFALEEGDDSLFMWDGTYIDEVPFEQYSIEEHKKRFMDRRKKDKEEQQNEIHYEYENKSEKLYIQGDTLFVELNGERMNVRLHEIKKVTIETIKSGFLGLIKKDIIAIYNKENELVITLPETFIDYGELASIIYDQTSHLKEPPFIEYVEFQ
ncbi:hypothetical protein ACIFOT_26760 [Neobacillus sp. NRS-1170]|uniref:hypothetical protein n=1 Tax=Neobacillus sp. NRS-1170 TaxID=3233898 RepID=UPI003D2DD698